MRKAAQEELELAQKKGSNAPNPSHEGPELGLLSPRRRRKQRGLEFLMYEDFSRYMHGHRPHSHHPHSPHGHTPHRHSTPGTSFPCPHPCFCLQHLRLTTCLPASLIFPRCSSSLQRRTRIRRTRIRRTRTARTDTGLTATTHIRRTRTARTDTGLTATTHMRRTGTARARRNARGARGRRAPCRAGAGPRRDRKRAARCAMTSANTIWALCGSGG